MIAIPRNAKNPVLAHHFLNYLLDDKHGYDNFSNYVGYQPPLTKLDPDRLVTDGVVPANLEDRDRARERLRQGLFADRADAGRPDGLAERLGRVQGGCLSPNASVGAGRSRRRLLGRPRAPRASSGCASSSCCRSTSILCVALGTVDPIFQTPSPEWNPLEWNTSAFEFVFEGLFTSGAAFETVFVRTFVVRRRRDRALAPHRVPGRVLRRALRRALEGAAARRAHRAVLHQLPDADARLDQPPPGRRLGERRARLARDPRRAAQLARRPRVVRDPRARLRLRAVHDPAALRVPRPHRPEPPRGRA